MDQTTKWNEDCSIIKHWQLLKLKKDNNGLKIPVVYKITQHLTKYNESKQKLFLLPRSVKCIKYNSLLMKINLPWELLQVEKLDYSTLRLSLQKSAPANKYMPPQSFGSNQQVWFQHWYLLKLWKHWLVGNQNTPVDPDEINIMNNLLASTVTATSSYENNRRIPWCRAVHMGGYEELGDPQSRSFEKPSPVVLGLSSHLRFQ